MRSLLSFQNVLSTLLLLQTEFLKITEATQLQSTSTTACIENNKFYRNPDRTEKSIWTLNECAKYYLCLDNEVFEFKCSDGLLFDVTRQICDFKLNVDNCDVTSEPQSPKPLLNNGNCKNGSLSCADNTCLPDIYFCDGSIDCPDGSDEGWCDEKNDKNSASNCDPLNCNPPECWCSYDGTEIPGNINITDVPQMIVITFDDAINSENYDLYSKLFSNERKNPNGCPVRATFYVSHHYTDYRDVQKLWNIGHEIAAHSITHRGPEEWWSKNATLEDWFDEMIGVSNIIHKFSAVRLNEIRGLRAPFLQVGWNRQFLMMKEFGFIYDSSIIAPLSDPPIWPYSFDYRIPHSCDEQGQNCPTRSYPGVWELPINQLVFGEYACTVVDECPKDMSVEQVYEMFMLNFERHYLTNRAPFGLHFNSMWFRKPMNIYAFNTFMDYLLNLSDVYFVTSNQVIEWMKKPTKIDDISSFKPWQCSRKKFTKNEIACDIPNNCKLPSQVLKSQKYLNTCFKCPKQYPWLRNEIGAD